MAFESSTRFPHAADSPAVDDRLLTAPDDPEAARRMARLRELGVEARPYAEFDELARRLAHDVGAPDGYAMVNFIGPDQQYFAGLYAPGAGNDVAEQAVAAAASAQPGRVMELDHGFCPHVVLGRKTWALRDVRDYPRFNSNPVVDELGIYSYIGTPLLDRDGQALGTMCVVATEAQQWDAAGVRTIKAAAEEVVQRIYQRAGLG
ncbi:MAG TPA: GAF domain-containing protein [Pseudonocardiaceae bacterium]|nr:GAF domain-containing protein [Pseudonocardiaceae bacterium]